MPDDNLKRPKPIGAYPIIPNLMDVHPKRSNPVAACPIIPNLIDVHPKRSNPVAAHRSRDRKGAVLPAHD